MDFTKVRPLQIRIHPYHADDLPQVRALEARVTPYRPEDQSAVEAMFECARRAEVDGDPDWIPQTPSPPDLDQIEDVYLAFWVAVLSTTEVTAPGSDQIVGMVGVYRAGFDSELPPHSPLARAWRNRDDVAELRRLRVAPEVRRQGIGAQLNETAIAWSRAQGYRTLVLNTTAAQAPALSLYHKLGFREVGRSFVGRYELVWLELAL